MAAMDAPTALEKLTHGVDAVYDTEELKRKLASGRALHVKLGMDPTAPDLHLGHAVALKKLRQFQDLGHKAVLIIGDYTARIGDPSGRDTTRPVLTPEEIEANARTYLDQAGRILHTDETRLELRYNSEWLSALSFADVLELTGTVTVQQMLHRDMFKRRMSENREIVLSELMYPLMQAHDSVAIGADVELGGTDQTFNNLLGRQLMERRGLEKQVVLVLPILPGVDGREKMSKSKGNHVGLLEGADEIFGKLMSIPDDLMAPYLRLLTDLPEERVAELLDPEKNHPREAKDALGRMVVEAFRGRDEAQRASAAFRARFSEGRTPDDLAETPVEARAHTPVELLRAAGFAQSNSEARRLVVQGGVSVDGERVTDPNAELEIADGAILKAGKRRMCRLRPGAASAE